ncbi:MAG: T9SS type A sorting domain-containing protein [Chitinophagaceae bacterium]|nr:T9SS type A sorting domain-containing protein [Chitinophagaceae bacterium]
MKKILLLLFCFSFIKADATNVSGIISTNTTWTKANSPYIVNDNLSVDSNVTLVIQPGVTVLVDSGKFFYVDGKLIAEGNTTDSIYFLAHKINDPLYYAQWRGITLRLKGIHDTSSFKYCRFEYALYAIYSEGPSLNVSQSVFKHNSVAVETHVFAPAVDCYFNINNCLVTENGKGLYNFSRYATGALTNCIISDNIVGCEDESYKGLTVQNNEFNYNETGLSLSDYEQSPDVRWNTFKGNSYAGLTFRNSPTNISGFSRTKNAPISNNLFIYNTRGLQIWDLDLCTISDNTIAYNDIGIDRNSGASNTPSYPDSLVITNNCLTNNLSYNFKENYTADFTLKYNWWGTTSIPGIDSSIYDYYDNFSSGKITYMPILTSDTGCQSVTPPPLCAQLDSVVAKATSPTTATVNWPAVPGALGYEFYVELIQSTPPTKGTVTTSNILSLTGLVPGSTYKICARTKCAAAPFIYTWVCDTIQVPTAINTVDIESPVTIYPNPSNGSFTIDLPTKEVANIVVTGLDGRVVYSDTKEGSNKISVRMIDHVAGIYLVHITQGQNTYRTRITIEE